MVQIFKS